MLAVFNGVGSGVVLRVYRAWQLNNQTVAVTGVLTTMAPGGRRRSRAGQRSRRRSMTQRRKRAARSALIASARRLRISSDPDFMRWMWSNDEPAASSLTSDETETIPVLANVYDATGDSNLSLSCCARVRASIKHLVRLRSAMPI